jgi:hypothetical protein
MKVFKMNTLKSLSKEQKIALLRALMIDLGCLVSQDEEWNVLFEKFEIELDSDTERPVIFGLSGSEIFLT